MSARRTPTTATRTRSRGSGRKQPSAGQKHAKFVATVLEFYRKQGRHHLPWRLPAQAGKKVNPYRILVSEVMLQQTQVDRVIPYYQNFLKQFPTPATLASSSLSDVLRAWQGLGYNRRAKMLWSAAKEIIEKHGGKFPKTYDDLLDLPGVGDYTAKAVRVFAYNEWEVLIETNVRAVYLHHFFPRSRAVPDSKLLPLIAQSVRYLDIGQGEAREWYAALMDYGSYLKKMLPNPSRKSVHHTRQKPFKGSDREVRGTILRAALNGQPLSKLPFPQARIAAQVKALKKEGLI